MCIVGLVFQEVPLVFVLTWCTSMACRRVRLLMLWGKGATSSIQTLASANSSLNLKKCCVIKESIESKNKGNNKRSNYKLIRKSQNFNNYRQARGRQEMSSSKIIRIIIIPMVAPTINNQNNLALFSNSTTSPTSTTKISIAARQSKLKKTC